MIIGIDPGVQNLGIAGINDTANKIEFIDFWTMPKNETEGYPALIEFIDDIIAKHGQNSCNIFIEKPFFTSSTLARNIRTLEIIGLIKYAVYINKHYDASIAMISPATIKKQATGNGRATKQDIIDSVSNLFSITTTLNSHKADAIACAYTGYKLLNE